MINLWEPLSSPGECNFSNALYDQSFNTLPLYDEFLGRLVSAAQKQKS